jgi:hypothetical protein
LAWIINACLLQPARHISGMKSKAVGRRAGIDLRSCPSQGLDHFDSGVAICIQD